MNSVNRLVVNSVRRLVGCAGLVMNSPQAGRE